MSRAASTQQKTPTQTFEELVERLAPEMAQVDKMIAQNLKSQSELAQKIAQHLISSGGKRLRPMLVLAAAHLADERGVYQEAAHIQMASAVELIHTATLLHDDVVDESAQRRNQPSARILWGNPASILVGDFLLGRAFEITVAVGELEALRVLSRTASIIAEGEVMQLAVNDSTQDDATQMDQTRIIEIISAKTASLFSAAAETGAILAQCSGEKRAALTQYGHHLGMAFQLMDDALDYDGASSKFGKPIGGDFREGKITLPMALCWQHANSAERDFWRAVISVPKKTRPSDFKKARQLMERHGSLKATRDYALDYAHKARATLKVFPDNVWRRGFENMVDFSTSRDF